MNVQAVRVALARYFDEQAEWREGTADEYPDEGRNATSAAALRTLAQYVRALPDTDARLTALAEIAEYVIPDNALMPGEDAAQQVSRYGFHQPTDPSWHSESESEFLDHFVVTCRGAAETSAHGQPGEANTSGRDRVESSEFDDN